MNRVARIKASKFSEMHAVDQGISPPHIFMVDRMRMTGHGDFFLSLIAKLAPAAVPYVVKGEITHEDIVAFARDITRAAYREAAKEKMLAMTVPPENTIAKILNGEK